MAKQAAAGPSGTALWTEKVLGGAAGRSRTILLLPDAANGPAGAQADRTAIYYYMPKAPLLLTDATGNPRLSLSLILNRRPNPDDPEIAPLIENGLLVFSVSLGLPDDALARQQNTASLEYQPLFARQITCSLEADDAAGKITLATVSGAGAAAALALSCHLDRGRALGVLAALDGEPSGLSVRTEITYRTAAGSQTVHLVGSWAAIYDYIDSHLDADGNLGSAALQSCFADMVRSQLIAVTLVNASGGETPLEATDNVALFQAFMRVASFILQKETTGLDPATAEPLYSLRGRPAPLAHLDFKQTVSGASQKTLVLFAPLEEVLSGVLNGLDRSRFINLIAPSGGSDTGLGPVPRRVRGDRPSGRSRDPQIVDSVRLACTGTAMKSLALAMTPDMTVRPSAHALLASDVVHGGLRIQDRLHWLADDAVLVQATTPLLSLPEVNDASAAVWPDHVQRQKYWYAPAFVPVQPAANMNPAVSPFQFTFSQSGVTGGPHPEPGLNGSIRITLQAMMSAETKARLNALGNPPAFPVPQNNLSVFLELPFRDEGTGETKSQLFPAQVAQQGDTVTATVTLLDSWVRLCYGALAYPGFQTQPARVSIAYAYRAYVRVNPHLPPIFPIGGKVAMLSIAASSRDVPAKVVQPVFNVADNTAHLPTGELRFQPEPVRAVRASEPAAWTLGGRLKGLRVPAAGAGALAVVGAPHRFSTTAAGSLAAAPVLGAARPAAPGVLEVKPAVAEAALVAHPQLTVAPALTAVVGLAQWMIQTVVHHENSEVVYPCATLGAFYVQQTADGPKSIGCQDALRLGQISYRQYEEMPDLAHVLYRVYRSLQQPGRFLVLPATYRITRYGPDEPSDKAYRPAIMIYAILDPDPAKNRYFFTATLQPDVPYFERKALQDKLVLHSPAGQAPSLEFPTDPAVQSNTTYQWALPSGVDLPDVQQTWDSFQVSLSTGMTNALALTSLIETTGIAGTATFTLPDGLVLTSRLAVDTQVVGPWQRGPIAVTLSPGSAALTNKIEQTVNVFDLATRQASGPAQQVKADLTLAPAASGTVNFTGAADEAYPVYAVVPGHLTLKELDIIEEEVVTNVIFVNLVNYANHGLSKLQVQARPKDTQRQPTLVPLVEGQSISIDLTLPLTSYLLKRVLEFQVSRTSTAGQTTTTAWLDWDLTTKGNVVSLTQELIQ